MGIPRPKIKNTGSAPKISIGYLTLITPKQLGVSCPCWKFSTKNFQANNLKSAVKILIYYRIYCRVFIITVLTVQAFLKFRGFDFRDFWFNTIYNSILFISPLVLLSNLNLRGFCFPQFFIMCLHIYSINRGMPVLGICTCGNHVMKSSLEMNWPKKPLNAGLAI